MSRFDRWAADVRAYLIAHPEESGLRAWGALTVFMGVVTAASTLTETGRRLTALDPRPFFFALAALWAVLPLHVAAKQRSVVIYSIGCFVTGLVPALWTAGSQLPGAGLFAGFFVLTAAQHGRFLRASPSTPYWFPAIAAEVAVALGVRHAFVRPLDEEAAFLWGLTLLASLVAAGVMGYSSTQSDRRRHQMERVQSALQAQILETECLRQTKLEEHLDDLLGLQHDLKSPLTAATLQVDELVELLARDNASPEVQEIARDVRDAVARLQRLTKSSMHELTEQVAVRLADRCAPIAARAQAQRVDIEVDVPRELFVGAVGEDSVERILDNLVQNAIEGDGKRGCRQVRIAALRDGAFVHVAVDDDGPGFPPQVLRRRIGANDTTKPFGTGLGLFTVERLAHACGGAVERMNRPEGGARVVVTLRAAAEPGHTPSSEPPAEHLRE